MTLNNLTVLIGKNGSGKSFILEALNTFFSGFDTIGGPATNIDDYLWYKRQVNKPIIFEITFVFDDKELKELFPFAVYIKRRIKKQDKETFNKIKIKRILDYETGWETELIKWHIFEIIRDNKIVEPESLTEKLAEFASWDKYYYYDVAKPPKDKEWERAIVDFNRKVAYKSTPEIDILISKDMLRSSGKVIDSIKSFAKEKSLKIISEKPTEKDIPELQLVIDANVIQQISLSLSKKFKDSYKLIPASRNVKVMAGTRSSSLEQTILDGLRTLSTSTNREDELKWAKIRDSIEFFLVNKRLEPNPQRLLIGEGDLRIPSPYLGGGEQEIESIVWELFNESKDIYAIEEPESHLHPTLSRDLFKFLRNFSENKQVIIATHSPLFVDKLEIKNNWVVKKEKRTTKTYNINNQDLFRNILAELGVLPSDIFLKDFVLFVEGNTEKTLFPIFCNRIKGVGLSNNIAYIVIGGESKMKNNLLIWLQIAEHSAIDYMVILDHHAEKFAIDVFDKLNANREKLTILEQQAAEQYYKVDLLVQAFKDVFCIDIQKEDLENTKNETNGRMDKAIEKILREKNKLIHGWKILLAEYIGEKMDIPKEFKDVIEKISAPVK